MRERTENDLNTPPELVALVRKVGPIVLDPCSNPWSAVGAKMTYSADDGQDGLALPWSPKITGAGVVFVNYPYGRGQPPRWWRKIAVEAAGGAELIVLCPTTPDTDAWGVARATMNARVDLEQRLKHGGGAHGSGLFASTVWYAGPRPYRFLDAFHALGEERFYGHGRRAA